MDKLKLFAYHLGIDRAVFFTILARLWTVGAGLLTIVFITRFLSPELQGYYYTFYSLIALQIFVELGLTFVIIQLASHEMAHLTWTPEGTVSGSPEAKMRMQSLIHFAITWFGVAALIMFAVLLPVGMYFFGAVSPGGMSSVSVDKPWSLLVVFAATNLVATAAVSILEGCGKVTQVAILRLWQAILSMVTLWIVLSLGAELYALVASSAMMAIVSLTWLLAKYRSFFVDILSHRSPLLGMSWRHEIWPFQWRIAVSWMSGYLAFQFINPLLFATHGPVVAGQMGMSLQIINAMNAAAMAWITTKVPTYGKLIAQRQLNALNELFIKGLRHSLIVLFVGIALALIVLWYLEIVAPQYARRILPFHLMVLLSLTALANHIVNAEAAYLRAYKRDPFMILSVISGIVIAVLSVVLVPSYSTSGSVVAYFTVAIFGLIIGTIIFLKKRTQFIY